MKVSVKVKAFCYACVNIGILGWSIIVLLDGASVQRSFLIFVVSLAIMNLLLWLLFRMRDKGSL
jgi:hypothetical protein